MPIARPFIVDPVLTAVAIGYNNTSAMRIADMVLPRRPVGAEQFKWTEYPISEAFNQPDARVSRRGRVNQLEFTGTERTSATEDFALESPIPYSDVVAADAGRAQGRTAFDPEMHAAMMLADTIQNLREARVASLVFNLNSYAASRRVTLSGTSQFSDFANSDPITAIKTGIDATLVFRANTIVMGRDVWSRLSSHPRIVNAVKGGTLTSGMVTREEFVNLFAGEGIRELLVGDGWLNTAKPGQAVSLSRAWGKHIALIYKSDLAQVEMGGVTFGLTAEYGGQIAGRIEDRDIGILGGTRIRVGERVKELIVARDVGYYIQNAVA